MTFPLDRKHLWAYTACYGDRFTFVYADDVRTSQKTSILYVHEYTCREERTFTQRFGSRRVNGVHVLSYAVFLGSASSAWGIILERTHEDIRLRYNCMYIRTISFKLFPLRNYYPSWRWNFCLRPKLLREIYLCRREKIPSVEGCGRDKSSAAMSQVAMSV
jgi:hypothetical protein